MEILRPNFEKRDDPKLKGWTGLVNVVVQDAKTKEVLMVAFANKAAVCKTLETGMATFFTTSRGRLWTKGEESGNFMKLVDILVDCDGDALLYLVEPQGNGVACHTEARSCFYRSILGLSKMPAPKAGDAEKLGSMEMNIVSNT